MDRNTIIGLILILALAFTWFFFFNDAPEPPANQNRTEQTSTESPTDSFSQTDTNAQAIAETEPVDSNETDSARAAREYSNLYLQYGELAEAVQGESEDVHIHTDLMDVWIDTKGAGIKKLILNQYETFDSLPLALITPHPENRFNAAFRMLGSDNKPRLIDTENLVFENVSGKSEINVATGDSVKVAFRAPAKEGGYIEFAYTFRGDRYDFGFHPDFDNLLLNRLDKTYELDWLVHMPITEMSAEALRKKSAIYYRTGEKDVETTDIASDDKQRIKENRNLDWVGFNGQFFTATLLSDINYPFESYDIRNSVPLHDRYSERMQATLRVDYKAKNLEFFTAPLKLALLMDYGRDMDQQLNLGYWGIMPAINKYLIYPVFYFLESRIANYGIIIIILSILIKLAVSPLTLKSYKSGAKMRIINQTEEAKAIDEKFKDDPTKLQAEKMSFYRSMGASPFGGCLPMLIQWPFLIAMFFFFPAMIELRQESFLWANDLSVYDSIIDLPFTIPFYGDHVSLFTLLMAIALMGSTIINQQSQATMQSNPMMKYMPYIMPVFLLFFMNSYSSGLALYYFVANLITIGQSTLTKALMNEEKILAQAHEFRKQKGKSGKKSRMEQWMEKQQKKQRDALDTRNKSRGPQNRKNRRK